MSAQNNKAFRPPQSSIDNFNLVWQHYGVDKQEAQYEKQRIMLNFADADNCYRIIADEIRSKEV